MRKEEIEAEQCLANLSQATNYIFQWQDKKPKNPQNYLIEEQGYEDQIYHSPVAKGTKKQRKVIVNREVSEKYDLKKWQKRVQAINKIQFPIIDNLQVFQSQYVLKKCKISERPWLNVRDDSISQRRQSINKKIIKAIQNQYILRKLEKFQKKLQNSKKNVFKQQSPMRALKYIPKGARSRRSSNFDKDNNNQEQMKNRTSNKSEIQKLKIELEKNRRKFSLPNLFKF